MDTQGVNAEGENDNETSSSDSCDAITPLDYSREEEEAKSREIRAKYRNLLENVKPDELVNPESSNLIELVQKVNKLFSKVTRTREATLDSQLLHTFASLGRQQAQILHTGSRTYSSLEYGEKLLTFLNSRTGSVARVSDEQWINVGKACSPLFKMSAPFHFMLGSFERGHVEVRVRKVRQKETNKDDSKAVVPKDLQREEKNYQESTTEEVERLLSILFNLYEQNDNKPLDYFEFVINPHSYAHTVENMFHTAFLIKDNVATIYLDEDGLPVIEPINQESRESQSTSTAKVKNQVVMDFDMKQWEEIVRVFEIEDALIPPRRTNC